MNKFGSSTISQASNRRLYYKWTIFTQPIRFLHRFTISPVRERTIVNYHISFFMHRCIFGFLLSVIVLRNNRLCGTARTLWYILTNNNPRFLESLERKRTRERPRMKLNLTPFPRKIDWFLSANCPGRRYEISHGNVAIKKNLRSNCFSGCNR